MKYFQSNLHEDGGRHVVVLHPHHDLLLHCQPGRYNKALILMLDSCLTGLEDIIYIWKTLSFHSLILSAQYFSH